jgi:PAS domain-containing protein
MPMTDVLNADGIVSGTELENRLQRPADNELGLGVEQALSGDLLTARLKGGVMVVDENFKIVMIDRRAAKFFGVSSVQ